MIWEIVHKQKYYYNPDTYQCPGSKKFLCASCSTCASSLDHSNHWATFSDCRSACASTSYHWNPKIHNILFDFTSG